VLEIGAVMAVVTLLTLDMYLSGGLIGPRIILLADTVSDATVREILDLGNCGSRHGIPYALSQIAVEAALFGTRG
jgi:hypothetical protein